MKKKSEPVTEFDENLRKIVADMFETMYKADGVGLAANQVGLNKSIITIDISSMKDFSQTKPLALINPVITDFSDEKIEFQEGCLSVPTLFEYLMRPEAIQLTYFDVDGKENKVEFNDFMARVAQHEFDHLNGILFFERLNPMKRALIKKKLKKIRNGEIVPNYPMVDPDGDLLN